MIAHRFGARSHLAPAFLNAPTSSFFLVSTLMTGVLSAAQRWRSAVMHWNWSSRFGWEAPASFLWLTRREKPRVLRSRATVRAQMSIPSAPSSAAILAVVRRVHFSPLSGSPAVSCFIRASRRARTSGVFFRRLPPAARAAHPVDLDVVRDELSSSRRDRGGVDAEQGRDAPVAAPAGLERFEAGEQTPLAFVEQAGEQHDGGAQLGGHQLGIGQGPYESGCGQQQAPGPELPRLLRAVGRAVEELAGELVPRQAAVADELAQRVLGADMEQVVELLAEMPRLCLVDERLGGGDQGAGAGEPDVAERPQSTFVEVDELVEGVVAAAMGVAGAGGEVLELAERGAPGTGSERRHDLGQRADGLLAEEGDDRVGGELGWSHCGTITVFDSRNGATMRRWAPPEDPETRPFLLTARQEILPEGRV